MNRSTGWQTVSIIWKDSNCIDLTGSEDKTSSSLHVLQNHSKAITHNCFYSIGCLFKDWLGKHPNKHTPSTVLNFKPHWWSLQLTANISNPESFQRQNSAMLLYSCHRTEVSPLQTTELLKRLYVNIFCQTTERSTHMRQIAYEMCVSLFAVMVVKLILRNNSCKEWLSFICLLHKPGRGMWAKFLDITIVMYFNNVSNKKSKNKGLQSDFQGSPSSAVCEHILQSLSWIEKKPLIICAIYAMLKTFQNYIKIDPWC